jgi:hypothetical protein
MTDNDQQNPISRLGAEAQAQLREFALHVLSQTPRESVEESIMKRGYSTPGELGVLLALSTWAVLRGVERGLILPPDLPRGNGTVRWSPGAVMEILGDQQDLLAALTTVSGPDAARVLGIRPSDWKAIITAGWITSCRTVTLWKYRTRTDMPVYWLHEVLALENRPGVDWAAVRAVPKCGRSLIPGLAGLERARRSRTVQPHQIGDGTGEVA